jgi:hypothetical protein
MERWPHRREGKQTAALLLSVPTCNACNCMQRRACMLYSLSGAAVVR